MELNVNEPLMKHRYCYQVTSKVGFRLHPMKRSEATCLLSLWCTVCRWQDHYIGSLMEREKQFRNVKRKSQRRMTREAESIEVSRPSCLRAAFKFQSLSFMESYEFRQICPKRSNL